MDILYYSNFCKHCQKIIQYVVSANLTDQLSCICIDKRKRDPNNNQTLVQLENGQFVTLPPNLQSVPAILQVKKNYTLVQGVDPILEYLRGKHGDRGGGDRGGGGMGSSNPLHPPRDDVQGYQLGALTSNNNIFSESFTSYGMTPDDLGTKSTSNNRPLHHYVPYDSVGGSIPTPEDTYTSQRLASNVTVDSLLSARNQDLPPVQMGGPAGILP